MQLRTLVLLGWIAMVGIPVEAWAFKINPCLRRLTVKEAGLDQAPIRMRNLLCPNAPPQLKSAVHEHMTMAAIGLYRGKNTWRNTHRDGQDVIRSMHWAEDGDWSKGPGLPLHRSAGIVYGTWWNDDPLMHLRGGDFAKGLFKFDDTMNKSLKQYPGGVLDCTVPAEQHLTRQSHYGGLQHLHFQTQLRSKPGGQSSTPVERVTSTLEQSMVWLEFAYAVATQSPGRAATSPLTPADETMLNLPSIARNLCLRRKPPTVLVRSLFTQQGANGPEDLEARNRLTPDVALGSMLHVLQDSFSPAHTCRVAKPVDGRDIAVLRDVYNYAEQDSGQHGGLDLYPAWLVHQVREGQHQFANDPVIVGAWLIGAVDKRLPWEEVRHHLLGSIFVRSDSAEDTKLRCITLD
ncbi:hypothetical protein ACSFA0_25330 [Variovorax sp. LT1P1]|uniref:hypothetical protein n=1 Tax=Variovorax sp. LT1P1 TaxID=3443730 RepID=UPI003F46ADE9